MSKFNKTKQGTKTKNLAGGSGYKPSPELELVSILLTSFVKDQFYRDEEKSIKQLSTIVNKLPDIKFAAQAGVYARNEFGMRSITHVLSTLVAENIKGKGLPWGKSFFAKVVHRTDDITEILARYIEAYGIENKRPSLPNAMKKGLAKAFDKFNDYQIAKYKASKKSVSLRDAINLVRPKPTKENSESIRKLMSVEALASIGTWETKLTQAGQDAKNDTEKEEFKAEAWKELIKERKLGYFALLKNLRNIASQAPEVLDEALNMLRDEKLIKRSLVMPFRYYTAYKEIEKSNISRATDIMTAIDDACEIALNNVPKLDGKTLVALDDSGSMTWANGNPNPIEIGALFSAVLIKVNKCDFLMFSDDAKYVNINPKDSLMTITKHIISLGGGGGTDFGYPFLKARDKYERIIILSDMQGWAEESSWGSTTKAPTAFREYKKKYEVNTHLYSFDLQGYGTLEFPESQVYCMAGFSEKIFDIMKLLEQDRTALINKIKQVEL